MLTQGQILQDELGVRQQVQAEQAADSGKQLHAVARTVRATDGRQQPLERRNIFAFFCQTVEGEAQSSRLAEEAGRGRWWSGESTPWFGVLVHVMDASLLASSVALGVALFRSRLRVLGVLFLGNLLLMLGAFLLRTSGVQFPRVVLFGADLYWLNLYLVGLVIWIRERPLSPNPKLQLGRAKTEKAKQPPAPAHPLA